MELEDIIEYFPELQRNTLRELNIKTWEELMNRRTENPVLLGIFLSIQQIRMQQAGLY